MKKNKTNKLDIAYYGPTGEPEPVKKAEEPKTVTGYLTRGKGVYSCIIQLFTEPIIIKFSDISANYRCLEHKWTTKNFNAQYTCKGFKLQPGDCILVEMEL